MDLRSLVEQFANRLAKFVDEAAMARARKAVEHALNAPGGRRTGRRGSTRGVAGTKSKKRPIQLCPVPRCRNAAAPIFGMVCAKHKDVPRSQIKLYRERRRARKARAA
jgi:hypothetical protein